MGEKKSEEINYQVAFGKTFNIYYLERYSNKTVDLIDEFIDHFELNGFYAWKGKIASSNRVPFNYDNRDEIINKAEYYNLWHVHIGIPKWTKSLYGNYHVSEWVLHFKKNTDYKITLLELGFHNPMTLPSEEICKE
ncbi:hypothetical protein [Acinetobacter oleivorans]|uniref:hypothetical protein n=1 Tax=Acinetobacter oleivorans TaxID=1148157 RepID=UPI001580214D|nr:hypothetical protein [Acinetobacter oleivorans]NUG02953.1 hypothetical protein [Acinetobacter oleivorans]